MTRVSNCDLANHEDPLTPLHSGAETSLDHLAKQDKASVETGTGHQLLTRGMVKGD